MFILLLDDKIMGISDYKELLESSLQDGAKILTLEEYLQSFTLAPPTENTKVDIIPSNPTSDNDDLDSSIELDPIFVLEAITDLQTQLEELKEVAEHEETN
ncbi:MAG: hypothetical protein EOM50_17715 [Erysipelotrichia bacterium]|nr:hypothetical protein [Erysipelotrichia bacterium]